MNKNRGIPLIKIEANNHYDFGFKLGSALKEKINLRLAKNKIAYKERGVKDYSKLVKFSKKFLPAIKKRYPDLLDEVKAMSLGANVDFDDLLVLMCEEELLGLKIPKNNVFYHCTNIAIKTKDKKILMGHNEDWLSEYKENGLVVIKGKIKDKKFLSLGYVGSLQGTSCGLTKKGFAFTVNSLNFKKFRYEVPRSFQLAELLEINDPKEITNILDFSKSSISGNTMMVLSNSKIWDIEELWNHVEKFNSNGWFIHTNHPILRIDRNKKNTLKESILRYNRATKILSREKEFSIGTIKKILSDHKEGICSHSNNKFYSITIASAIMNPKDKWIEVCYRNPCKNKYKRYYL